MKAYAIRTDGVLERYSYLWRMPADRWAWEYLRRNRYFRRDAGRREPGDLSERAGRYKGVRLLRPRVSQTAAQRWGLVFMPDPDKDSFEGDVVWNVSAFPDQVSLDASPRRPSETCTIWNTALVNCDVTHISDWSGREYLLLRRHGTIAQLRCGGVSLIGVEPVRLKLTIADVDSYEQKIRLQRAFLALCGGADDADQTPVWTKKTQILRDGLVALDCLDQGMSRREIALLLYGADNVGEEWDHSTARHAMRYLIKKAEALRDGGYLVELLGARVAVEDSVA